MRGKAIIGKLARMARSATRTARPLILMYHRIGSPATDPWDLAVSTKNFAAQIDVLKACRTPVPMSWLARQLASGKTPHNVVAVTFDDAYADVLLNGRPIMNKAGVPATMFVPAAFIDGTDGFWWDTLTRIFLEPLQLPDTLEFCGQSWVLADRSPNSDQKRDAFQALWAHLKRAGMSERRGAMSFLCQWAGIPVEAKVKDRCMTSNQLAQFYNSGMFDLGGHTVTHPSLPMLSPKQQRQELGDSIDWLRERFGLADMGLAYPYGDNDAVTRQLTRESGASYACTTHPSAVRQPHDRYGLPRLQVNNLDAEGFEQLLAQHA